MEVEPREASAGHLPIPMSASSGLQRRRAPGSESHKTKVYDSDEEEYKPSDSSQSRSRNEVLEKNSGSGSIAAVDIKSGHRYAYDPRDLNDEQEILTHPRLNMMEEVLLLGLKDRQGYLSFWNENISYTLRGCILIELALRDRICVARHPDNKVADPADRMIEVCNPKNTGEPLLDEALRIIKTNPPASIVGWMDLLSGT